MIRSTSAVLMMMVFSPLCFAQHLIHEESRLIDRIAGLRTQAERLKHSESLCRRLDVLEGEINRGLSSPPEVSEMERKIGLASEAIKARIAFGSKISKTTRSVCEKLAADHPQDADILELMGLVEQSEGKWEVADGYYRRALACRKASPSEDQADVAVIFARLANVEQKRGRIAEAVSLYEQARDIFEKSVGLTDTEALLVLIPLREVYLSEGKKIKDLRPEAERQRKARDLSDKSGVLAKLFLRRGDIGLAEDLYRLSLDLSKTGWDSGHAHVAVKMFEMAELYRHQSRLNDAAPLYEQALSGLRNMTAREYLELLKTINQLTDFYNGSGQQIRATSLLKEMSRTIHRLVPASNRGSTADLDAFVKSCQSSKLNSEVETLLKLVIEERQKSLGIRHPYTAREIMKLANHYFKQEKNHEAKDLYERSLEILAETLGSDHPDVFTCLYYLTVINFNADRTTEAENLGRRALAISTNVLGSLDEGPASIMILLGNIYIIEDTRLLEAENLILTALNMYRPAGTDTFDSITGLDKCAETFNREHRDQTTVTNIAVGLTSLATLYEKQNEFVKSANLYRQALAFHEFQWGLNHLGIVTSLHKLALFFINRRQYNDAEPLLKRALQIRESQLGRGNQLTEDARRMLAKTYFLQRRFAESEVLYKEILDDKMARLGPDHRDVADILRILSEIFKRTDRQTEANNYAERARRIRENAK